MVKGEAWLIRTTSRWSNDWYNSPSRFCMDGESRHEISCIWFNDISLIKESTLSRRWFVGALLLRPFQLIGTGKKFSCQLILVMGVKATAKSLLNRWIDIYYYRMRRDLNQLYIPNLMKRSVNPKHFVINLFKSYLNKVSKKNVFIHYLNQISGPTLEGWKLQPSTNVIEGTNYHQCRMGPNHWVQRAPIFKEYEGVCK
jgi:hypothetical protein